MFFKITKTINTMKQCYIIILLFVSIQNISYAQWYNTATGWGALATLTTGDANTATGFDAMYWSNNIWNCSSHGTWALFVNTGSSNSAYGGSAMYSNGSGYENSALGFRSLFLNTSGYRNTAVGVEAMYNTDNTGGCTALGYYALHDNVSGNFNTAVGAYSGVNGNASYNTYIGAYADANAGYYTNSTAIGYGATVTASNMIRFGDNSVTSIGGSAGWYTFSDRRIKRNIQENVPGLSFIKLLKPVTYNIDLTAVDAIVDRQFPKGKDGKKIDLTESQINARKAKEATIYTGFIAQDVLDAASSINYEFSGVDAAKNEKDLFGLRYAEFVVPLVKATQELSNIQDSLKLQISELKVQVKLALERIEKLRNIPNMSCPEIINNSVASKNISELSLIDKDSDEPYLGQNIPNPNNGSTTILYRLPATIINGQIVLSDLTGSIIKTFVVDSKGSSQISVNTSHLASGTYVYTLIAGGKIISSKKMIISR